MDKKNIKNQKNKTEKEPKVDKIRLLFNNKALYDQATRLALAGQKAGYERLEFLGDRVLGIIVAEMLYVGYPNEAEGQLARRFVALTCAKTLAKVAKSWELEVFSEKSAHNIRHNKSILSDVCEAVIAALYLDQGLDAARNFIQPIWEPLMRSYEHAPQDSKSALQEYAQKNFGVLPIYTLVEQHGQSHAPEFTVKVQAGPYLKMAKGGSIKKAEQEAAYLLLQEIQHDS